MSLERQRSGSRRVPKEDAATEVEVVDAISSLSGEDLVRLSRAAFFFAQSLGGRQQGRDGDDLLQVAIIRTLDGDRSWNKKKTDFLKHLRSTMRSIVSGWKGHSERRTPIANASIDEKAFPEVRSEKSSQEDQVVAKEQVDAIDAHFSEDAVATQILEALKSGISKPREIRELYDLEAKAYDAAWKRITRYARK